jgi:hypothetical protein
MRDVALEGVLSMRKGLNILGILLLTASMSVAQRPDDAAYPADPFSPNATSLEDGNSAMATENADEWKETEEASYQKGDARVMSPVQRNAFVKAEQRRQRIAARKWFGLSNSRPVAAANPYFTPYSPSWVGSYWQPYFWYGGTIWR